MKRKLVQVSLVLLAILLLVACSSTTETAEPTTETAAVTEQVVEEPTDVPTEEPTEVPTEEPTEEPTAVPTEEPTVEPTPAWEPPRGALVSYAVTDAPVLDGVADESVWADAVAIEVEVEDGANDADGFVEIKSVYTDDLVYFLVTWNDPTQSFMRSPWVKQEDGTWIKLVDPDDRGGDNNVYYEDKMSFIWNINNSIPDFEDKGCFVACHSGEDSEFKPYGNKYTDEEGQLGDIWHWKSVRNVNQLDDQYLDWTQYSAETPGAGRHGDPNDGGGYVNNQTEDGSLPAFMGPEGYAVDGSPGFILDGEQIAFDDSMFAAGDMIPGIVKASFEGDRGDLSGGWQWVDGTWTLEIGRAHVTGSDYDVQYDDLTASYFFGVAIFDNAQVRHAYQFGSSELVFQPLP